jgi:hypothetical protein
MFVKKYLHSFGLLNCWALGHVAQWLIASLSSLGMGFIGIVLPIGVFHSSIAAPHGHVFFAMKS